jgi:hypothetical protein
MPVVSPNCDLCNKNNQINMLNNQNSRSKTGNIIRF